ncbi:MAG: O-antigen ligase family protein [Solobacterium sp.]|nr:O-antigen ligase family protein [Solobacterium sp.]
MNSALLEKAKRFLFNRYHVIGFYLLSTVFLDLGLRSVMTDLHWELRYHHGPNICILWTAIIVIHDIYKKRLEHSKETLLLWLYLAVCLLSGFLSYFGHSFKVYWMLQLMFCYVFFTAPRFPEDGSWRHYLDKYAKIIIIFVTVMSTLSIIFYFTKWTITLPNGEILDYGNNFFSKHYKSDKIRYIGILDDVLPGSMRCTTAILLGFYLQRNGKLPLWFQLFNIAVNSWVVYMTDTRMSMLVLLFTVVYIIMVSLCRKFGRPKGLLFTGILILLCLGAVFLMKQDTVLATYAAILENPFYELTRISSARLKIWHACLVEFMAHPILGVGLENNAVPYSLGYPFTHNLCISILLYTGIVGAVIALAFFILCMRDIIRNRRYLINTGCRWLILTTAMIFFQSMLENAILGDNSHIETGIFWFLLGWLVFCRRTGTTEQK